MLEDWILKKKWHTYKCKMFNVLEKEYINPENNINFIAQVLELPSWVNIIGTDEDGNILLIKQYRFGTDTIELEIPGGIIEPKESPKKASIRELKEETGYDIKSIRQIGFVNANPAIMNNKCYTFLAELSEKGAVKFDPNEIIETEFASPNQVKNYLYEGKITNAYVICAFLWYFVFNLNDKK